VVLGEKHGREMLALIRLDDLLDLVGEAVAKEDYPLWEGTD